MAFYFTPGEETDKYGNPTEYDIRIIDSLPNTPIKGQFDKTPDAKIATVTLIDEQSCPIELDKITASVSTLLNNVLPTRDNSEFHVRYRESGPTIYLKYKDGEGYVEFVSITMLASEVKFPNDFASRLCAVYDTNGGKTSFYVPNIHPEPRQRKPR